MAWQVGEDCEFKWGSKSLRAAGSGRNVAWKEKWTTEPFLPSGASWGIQAVSLAKQILPVLQFSGHPGQVVIRADMIPHVSVPNAEQRETGMESSNSRCAGGH